MNYATIPELLNGLEIPYAYYQFPEGTATEPPFICFYYPDQSGFYADNKTYAKRVSVNIELYTKDKNFELEQRLEDLLDSNEIGYRKYESYIDSEKLYMQTYESEVFINGK